jgi:hypothetical protein
MADFKKLASLALTLPGLSLSGAASAQTSPEPGAIRFQYGRYQDYQGRLEKRISVDSPSFWFRAPISNDSQLEGGVQVDSVTGASPLYLDSLSGASGIGVSDFRRAADLKYTKFFDRYSLAAQAGVSKEDDYQSVGGSGEFKWWTDDKNTILTLGYGGHADNIKSTNRSALDDFRRTFDYFAGVTQNINKRSFIQSNIGMSFSDGFHSDQYKFGDLRPRSREQYAWLNRYRLFFPESGSALHVDYRFGFDSWNIDSHTVDLSWYRPVGDWIVRPRIRYYTQDRAFFYSSDYPPEDFGAKFYSTDFRLTEFGSITTGLQVIKNLGQGVSWDLSFDYIVQRTDLALHRSHLVDPVYAYFIVTGITKKF